MQYSEEISINEYDTENRLISELSTNNDKMAYTYYVKTNGSNLNLRAEPNISAEIVGSLKNGSKLVTTNEIKGEWVAINDNGVLKYFSAYYVVNEQGERASKNKPDNKVSSGGTIVETTTDSSALVTGKTDYGTENPTNWLKIGCIATGVGVGIFVLSKIIKG